MPLNQVREIPNEESIISTIFIERQPKFDVRLQQIKIALSDKVNIRAVSTMRRFLRYEVQGLNYEEIWRVNYQVFSTLGLDSVIEPTELFDQEYILPLTYIHSKYDLKLQSAVRLLNFYFPYREIFLRSSEIFVFGERVNDSERKMIQDYFLEQKNLTLTQLKPAENLAFTYGQPDLVPEIDDFTVAAQKKLKKIIKQYDLKIQLKDLQQLQQSFKDLKRNPTETELLLINQIWAERLAKSRANPEISKVTFDKDIAPEVKATHELFLKNNKQSTDYEVNVTHADDKQVITETQDIQTQKKFIEDELKFTIKAKPFSTSAINSQADSLSSLIKSSVMSGGEPIQAMRLSMAYLQSELDGKKQSGEQSFQVSRANQIRILRNQAEQTGLYAKKSNVPIDYVHEYYLPEFKDDYWEVLALIAQDSDLMPVSQEFSVHDLIVMLGARTAPSEDNIGSRPEMNNLLTRFIINPKTRKMLKTAVSLDEKGLAAAALELKGGTLLNLDVIPVERSDLSGTEISFSKTPDRAIVVISPKFRNDFISSAQANDLAATVIGKVTQGNNLEINFRGQRIVNLAKSFVDYIPASVRINPKIASGKLPQQKIKNLAFSNYFSEKLLKINNSSQQGLNNNFANHINGKSRLSALGGSEQSTPEHGMIAKIDNISNKELYSIVTQSSYPELIEDSPYHAAYYSVYSSLLKNVALGGNPATAKIRVFNALTSSDSDQVWGNFYSLMLGGYQAQQDLDLTDFSIENQLVETNNDQVQMPFTIIFTLNKKEENKFITSTLSKSGLYGYLVDIQKSKNGLPDHNSVKETLREIHRMINEGEILHTTVCETDLATTVFRSCLGESLGFEFDPGLLNRDIFAENYGSLIIFSQDKMSKLKFSNANLILIGKTISEPKLIRRTSQIDLAKANKLYQTNSRDIYPLMNKVSLAKPLIELKTPKADFSKKRDSDKKFKTKIKLKKPKVLLPVFKGTIGEQRLTEVLVEAGAEIEQFIFYSTQSEWSRRSVKAFSEKINNTDALILPGGYDLNDQPEGVAKLLCLILEIDSIKNSINCLLERGGKILGIGNGFQALVACGLLPYGRYREWGDKQGYFAKNLEYSNYNGLIDFEVVSDKGNWYKNIGETYHAVLIADYWYLNMPASLWDYCIENNLIVTKYKTGSNGYVESLASPEGNIIGRMTHPEFSASRIINLPDKQDIDFFKRFISNLITTQIESNKELSTNYK